MDLPGLSESEEALLGEMQEHLRATIEHAGGNLPFDHYMDIALYAPGLGYYVNGRRKFGESGDFTTSPEVSPLFSQCLAQQIAECLDNLEQGVVLEFGAGSGRMAVDVLRELQRLDALPGEYLILELSPDLQSLQRATLSDEAPELLDRVRWLTAVATAEFRGSGGGQ